jgi:hypothetical protein
MPAVLSGRDELSVCLNTATLRSVYLHGVTRSQAVHLPLLLPYPFSLLLFEHRSAHPNPQMPNLYTDESFSAEHFIHLIVYISVIIASVCKHTIHF